MHCQSDDGLGPGTSTGGHHDESVPQDILEQLGCLIDTDPSIPASWDVATTRPEIGYDQCSSKSGTSSSALPWSRCSDSTLRHCNFAISCTETINGTEHTQPHDDLYIGVPPSQTDQCPKSCVAANGCNAESSAHASPDRFRQGTHGPLRKLPQALSTRLRPIPTQSFCQIHIPKDTNASVGRTRRDQAALLAHSGPPRMKHILRPISAPPAPCRLNKEMILDVCGVDCSEAVQVLCEKVWLQLQLCSGQQASPLQEIKLINKGLVSVDKKDIKSLKGLKSIIVENNSLEDISPFGQLETLQNLNVACNKLKSLPALSTGLFYKLQVLDVSFNSIPVSDVLSTDCDWSRLPSLRQLDLSGNSLRYLPEVIGSFPALVKLFLEFNQLTAQCLHPLARLPLLEHLGLAENHISDIPLNAFEPSAYRCLKVLDVSRNRIREPDALAALKQIWNGTTVYVGDNPIARKMRLHLLQPSAIPGTRPGTVQLPTDAYESSSTTILASGMGRGSNDAVQIGVGAPSCTLKSTPHAKHHSSSVVLKFSRNMQSRPTLAKSMMDSITCVKRCIANSDPTAWKSDSDASEKLQRMFDNLQHDIDKWKQLESVMEESPSLVEEQTSWRSAPVQEVEPGGLRTEQPPKSIVDYDEQDWARESERLLSTSSHHTCEEGHWDPTEHLAAQLGLDRHLLSHQTGLLGTDANGAASRLRFMLTHLCQQDCYVHQPRHQFHTKSSIRKQRQRNIAHVPLIKPPEPASPHERQVDLIQGVLHSMRTKLSRAQKEIATHLQQYNHLLNQQPQDQTISEDEHQGINCEKSTMQSVNSITNTPRLFSGIGGGHLNMELAVDSADVGVSIQGVMEVTKSQDQSSNNESPALVHSGAQNQLGYTTG